MGKLGGEELNPSSDIDIVFAYPEIGKTKGKNSISNDDFFNYLAKEIIATFTDYSEDGILFRVDLRLRPFGSDGLLVNSLASLESYFESHGLDWERYAWLKARIILGPQEDIYKIIYPFVYRQYLDFNVFESLRLLKAKINTDMVKRVNEGDIKVGAGGIRTAEFIVQSHQIVWGGKNKELRSKNFMQALKNLEESGILKKEYEALKEAYSFLRSLEHRLQYLDDKQTHLLPKDDNDQKLIARSMNFSSLQKFKSELRKHQSRLESIFSSLFSEQSKPKKNKNDFSSLWLSDIESDETVKILMDLSFKSPTDISKYLINFKNSSVYKSLTPLSKSRFDNLAPLVIESSSKVNESDRSLISFFNFLAKLAKRSSYLSLLRENPNVLDLMLKITSFDPLIIEKVAENPIIIDDLLNTENFLKPVELDNEIDELINKLKQSSPDIEFKINQIRQFKNSIVFKLAVQEIMGIFPVENISDTLSETADFIVEQLLRLVWFQIYPKKKYPPIAVIAYGKLGGKEMSYLSDLDLVFLYQDDEKYSSEQYLKLIQRFNSWATSYTGLGFLYDIDLRLRPDGGSGLLVTNWSAFKEYQTSRALVWEQQAICKARFSSGNIKLKNSFEKLRKEILFQKKDQNGLRKEIVNMRDRIFKNKNPNKELFDLKHSEGGMIEIEFITQYFVLAFSHKHIELSDNIGNIALIDKLSKFKLMTKNNTSQLIEAYRFYRELQHKQGINPENPGIVSYNLVSDYPKKIHKIWRDFSNKN